MDLWSLLLFLLFALFAFGSHVQRRREPGPRGRGARPGPEAPPPVSFPVPPPSGELEWPAAELEWPTAGEGGGWREGQPGPAAGAPAAGEGASGQEGGDLTPEIIAREAQTLGSSIEREVLDIKAEAARLAAEAEHIGSLEPAGPPLGLPAAPVAPGRLLPPLRGRAALAQAVVLREVLGPPRALEPFWPRHRRVLNRAPDDFAAK